MAIICVVAASLFTAAFTLCVHSLNVAVSSFDNKFLIVLDAGHGGIDSGVIGRITGTKESDINLSITLKLSDLFERAGFKAILTRRTDAGLYGTTESGFKKRDMKKREEIIKNANPVAVISIHQNYYPSVKLRGGQVFFKKDNIKGQRLAERIQKKINYLYGKHDVKYRKAIPGDYFMLKCTDSPSVIVECGFLSNSEDEAMLISEKFQQDIAFGIFSGYMDYFKGISGI